MAPAKAQAKPKQETSSKPAPVWVWLVVGVIIGLFIAFLTYLVTNKPNSETGQATSREQPKQTQPKTTPPPTKESSATKETTEPRFTFYTDLQKMTVEIPEEELQRLKGDSDQNTTPQAHNNDQANKTIESKQTSTTPTLRGPAYILQAGSFKSHRDADRLKAKLAFMGVEANIQAVSVNSSDRWYRVRIGPFANQKQANATKQKLKQKSIPAIVLKLSN